MKVRKAGQNGPGKEQGSPNGNPVFLCEVLLVLIGETPEDVTQMMDTCRCRVLASTFDQPPENHLRIADLAVDYARRQAEYGKDVVVVLDSLTRLAKTVSTTAAQQGRATPGTVNPASLNRAKKLFGTARALREGGSVTIVGVMNSDVSRLDDSIVEEFKSAANAVVAVDASLARAGISPALNLQACSSRHPELLVSEEGLANRQQLRTALSPLQPAAAMQQLGSMLDAVGDNETLLKRVPEWLNVMKDGRARGN